MKTLLVGYKASDLSRELLADETLCHVLDVYHRHAIEKVWHVKAICKPHLPDGPWDLIRFKTGPKLMSGEVALDLLQEIHVLAERQAASGAVRPKIEIDYVGRERDRNDLVNKIKDDPKRVRDFSAKWSASVPGGEKLEFTSFPGCFCHRRLDEGGLALAEVASRDLVRSTSACQLLDMGCGCGLVSYLIRSVCPNVALTLVDSHSRAVEAAELNAKNFGFQAEVILADNGTPKRMDGQFDVFVGNPPYYSDYRIAEVFLETAQRALKPGGVCYTVCKNAAGLEPVQKKYFPEAEIIHRRGYAVLRSRKTC